MIKTDRFINNATPKDAHINLSIIFPEVNIILLSI